MPDTYVDVANGEDLLVQIGDGASPGPETFAHDCMLNGDRAISMTASTITNTVPRCDDPKAPSKTMRVVDALDTTITSGGKMNAATVAFWLAWWKSGLPKNIRMKHAKTGSWQVAAPYLLTSFGVNGVPKTNADVSVTLEQADAPVVSVVAA